MTTVLSQAALDRLSIWIVRRMERDATPGLSLAITGRDGVLHTTAFGMTEIASKTPVTPPRLPERIRFDALIDGKTHRANLSGGDFYRVDAP